jgi:hypothetical protein
MRHPVLDVVKDPAGDLGQPGVAGGEGVKLVAMEDQERDLAVPVDVFVLDLDPHDMADDVGRAIVVAADPGQVEVVTVRVPPDDLQAGEVPLGEPLEVEVVEDVAVDDQLAGLVDGPFEELLEQPGLADGTPQVQVADDDAVVGEVAERNVAGREAAHSEEPIGGPLASRIQHVKLVCLRP